MVFKRLDLKAQTNHYSFVGKEKRGYSWGICAHYTVNPCILIGRYVWSYNLTFYSEA